MYRPQRLIRTPVGFRDQPYAYTFNDLQLNTPTGQIVPGGTFGPLVVVLDQDADFYLCAIAFTTGKANVASVLGIRLQDCFGRVMSDDFCAIPNYAISPLAGTGSQASSSGFAPIFQDPVYNQAGGSLQFTIKNFSDTIVQGFGGPLEFRGFKRYKACYDDTGALQVVSPFKAAA